MANTAGVAWEQLSRGVRDALAWARAAEIDAADVGTRGLLIGMLRSGEDPANALLRHFGLLEADVFAELQRLVPDKRLDPAASERPALERMPGLTANARACIDRAAELQRAARLPSVDVACLLAALLQTRAATARAALEALISSASIEAVAESTVDWLRGNDLTYPQTLQRRFPRPPPRATKAARDAPPPDADAPWPFLGVLRRHVSPGGPAGFRPSGLGARVGDAALITAAPLATASAGLHLPSGGTEHDFRPLAVNDQLALLELTPPPAHPADLVPATGDARAGEPCAIATVDDQFLDVSLVQGVVATGDDLAERFVVDLTEALADNRTAQGSPVLNASGELIGIVGPRTEDGPVEAVGRAALERLLAPTAAPPAPAIATGTLSGAGNDAVGDVDQLGFTTYVKAFADLIASPYTKPPLTIGIFGSWGMGKSFLLEHIAREIAARQPPGAGVVPRVHVVRFNAWEYSATEVVWPGLVRKIVTRLDQLETWPWHKRMLTRARWNLARQWRHLRTQLVAGALAVGTAIAVAVSFDEAGVATAIAGVTTALGAGGLLKAARDPVAQWVTALFADRDYGRQLGVMEDIKHDLESLEERLHRDVDGDDIVTGRILILIDDLDRCEPAKAVEVLQAVNLLLNFRSFIVCLGIDARIITGAVEKHYEGLLGRAGASGYEYLDKIVQIPFRIPEPGRTDILTFIAGQLGDPPDPQRARAAEPPPGDARPEPGGDDGDGDTGGDGSDRGEAADDSPSQDEPEAAAAAPIGRQTADLDRRERARISAARQRLRELEQLLPETEGVPFTYAELQAFEIFVDHMRPNPRHLKRLVNVYRLVRALARAQDEALILERPAATIRWLVMWSQWPYTSLAMVERFERLHAVHGDALAEKVPVERPLLHLLDEVEAGLHAATRDRLDDAPDRLRGLLKLPGCELSWDEIRRIRPFTVNFNPAVEEQVRPPAPVRDPA